MDVLPQRPSESWSSQDMVGFGRFQMRLLLIAGCGFMADSIEVGGMVAATPRFARTCMYATRYYA